MVLDWVRCPQCCAGQIFNKGQMKFVPCNDCRGRGIVPRNVRCACGLPITTVSADEHYYCGDKVCLVSLRNDKREEEEAAKRPKVFAAGYTPTGTYSASQWHAASEHNWPGYGPRDDD